jgi:hypothetical protein
MNNHNRLLIEVSNDAQSVPEKDRRCGRQILPVAPRVLYSLIKTALRDIAQHTLYFVVLLAALKILYISLINNN